MQLVCVVRSECSFGASMCWSASLSHDSQSETAGQVLFAIFMKKGWQGGCRSVSSLLESGGKQ